MKALAHHVGECYWKWPQGWTDECKAHGPSFRINGLLDVGLPCPVFVSHNKAVLTTNGLTSLEGVWQALIDGGFAEGERPDWRTRTYINPETNLPWKGIGTIFCEKNPIEWPMRSFYEALAAAREKRKFGEVAQATHLVLCEGVFGFTWITEYEYVVGEGETADDVPDNLKGKVTPVKVIPLDKWPGVESGGLPVTDGCIVKAEGRRGCGHRRKGVYAVGSGSALGVLKPFTPMSPALYGQVPERVMSYVDFDTMLAAKTLDVAEAMIGVSGETRDRNEDKELLLGERPCSMVYREKYGCTTTAAAATVRATTQRCMI